MDVGGSSHSSDTIYIGDLTTTGNEVIMMGSVGIGTNSLDEKLTVNGNVKGDAFINSSDRRYKKDITPLTNVLEKLEQINGVYYNWKVEEFPQENFDRTKQLGVIAQEIEAVFPELVVTNADGYKAVDYPKLTAVLLEANKELAQSLKDQSSRVQALEADLEAIKAMVNLDEQAEK